LPARYACLHERAEHTGPAERPAERRARPRARGQANYAQQFVTLEAYRARAGSLLAFAAVLVAISTRRMAGPVNVVEAGTEVYGVAAWSEVSNK